jgi:hypothetical protein
MGNDEGHYYLGGFNGESTGEGIGRKGNDNNLLVVGAVDYNFGDYGSRGYEGDMRTKNDSFGATMGVSTIYGEGNGDPAGIGSDNAFERFDLDVDGGIRVAGFAAQTDFFYSHVNLDKIGGNQGGSYLITKEWGVATRYGYIQPDDDISAIDSQHEFNAVVNYFINGHNLKLQNQVTWLVTDLNDDNNNDYTDFRYECQLAGYF